MNDDIVYDALQNDLSRYVEFVDAVAAYVESRQEATFYGGRADGVYCDPDNRDLLRRCYSLDPSMLACAVSSPATPL